jgi:hypothetical protein
MKLWIDDERPCPDGWVAARNRDDAVAIINTWFDHIKEISFDHDLGEGKTGYDIALTLEKMVWETGRCPMILHVHSMNPVGRKNIMDAIIAMKRYAYAHEARQATQIVTDWADVMNEGLRRVGDRARKIMNDSEE